MISRPSYLKNIEEQFKVHSIVALLGPRQCGKTTIARQFIKDYYNKPTYIFDLENPTDLQMLANPQLVLNQSKGLVVIDEIQRLPDLFPLLRVLVDRPEKEYQFLILGSASRDLIRQSSESLAGRIAYIEVHPFNIRESVEVQRLHLRGGFPRAYLADSDNHAFMWLENYVRTFLERDIPMLGFSIPPQTMRRFWSMLAHYHGGIFNSQELARSLGVSDHTVRSYLDILCGTFMIRQLLPWYENIQKRQIKRPKIYFRDSGLLHLLLSISEQQQLIRHPKVGASWEGFAMEEIIRFYGVTPENCYFWGVHQQLELDLLLFHKGDRLGFEFKYADAPKLTPQMLKIVEQLNLASLSIIYPGEKSYPLHERISVVPLIELQSINT